MSGGGRVAAALAGSLVIHGGAVALAVRWSQREPPEVKTAPPRERPGELLRVEVMGGEGRETAAQAPEHLEPKPPARVQPHRASDRKLAVRPAPAPVQAQPDVAAPVHPDPPEPATEAQAIAGEGEAPAAQPAAPDVATAETSSPGAGAGNGTGSSIQVGPPSPRPSPGPGPGVLALWHQRIAEAARRCYPAAARRFRLQGEVVVRFCTDGKGGLTQVAAVRSSGSALLDRAALDCVLPGATPLEGPSACERVPVVFREGG